MSEQQSLAGLPDLTQGIGESDLVGGKLVGRVGDSEVLLVRSGSALFAVGARCSHYQGPLAEGIVVADTVRCPWHHACFDLRNGEAVRAPALTALDCWAVEIRGGRIYVTEKSTAPRRPVETPPASPNRIVIVGGGAAGFAAAEMLRRCGFAGSLVMLSQDDDPPVDRPNLSKDFLAGSAPEDWVPLRPDDFYQSNGIELRLNTEVVGIDVRQHAVQTADGQTVAYDRLLLAMGAEPVRLTIPGAERPHVYTLRSLRDCRAIIARATAAQHAVVVGASFIGLEVAASLRTRGLAVHVVAPESRPMERIFGPEMADFVRDLHEQHGVAFHLQDTVTAIDENSVRLRSGSTLKADLVIVGVGVRPRITLAEKAGLKLDRGIAVDGYLRTSAPDIYAAGDIVRWPDPYSGSNIRVEHWVVAERQGQTAARNMLGMNERFDATPFFWSQHYDVPINYVGHAEDWDEIVATGDIKAKDCLLQFKRAGRVLAVASIFRDVESLEAELAMERVVQREGGVADRASGQ